MKILPLAFALMFFTVIGFAQTAPMGAPTSTDMQSLKKSTVKEAGKAASTDPSAAKLDEYDKLLSQVRAQQNTSEPQALTDRAQFAFGKALAYSIGVGLLVIGIAVFKTKLWQLRPGPMSKTARIALVATAIWLLTVQLWGCIFGWGSYFDEAQYATLHLSVPLLAVVAWLGQRWIGKA